jgi:HEAT repeats
MKTRASYATDSFELVGGPYSVLQGHPAGDVWFTDVPRDDLSKAVARFLQSGQSDRSQALIELAALSRQGAGADPLAGVKLALTLIFDSGIHGRVSSATEFLIQIGPRYVQKLASLTEQPSGKFGYALVRALGALRETNSVIRFLRVQDDSVREAVAEALDDIGDQLSLQVLAHMRDNDPSDFIRRLAGELSRDR